MHIELRPVTDADIPTLWEQQADQDANDRAGVPSRSPDNFAEHWARLMSDPNVDKQVILADGEIAGQLVRWTTPIEHPVGYWLGRAFWGKGIATEALQQFIQIVTVRPLTAYVASTNPASVRVLEKCGFTHVPAYMRTDEHKEDFILTLEL